jgi:hypothetical protein
MLPGARGVDSYDIPMWTLPRRYFCLWRDQVERPTLAVADQGGGGGDRVDGRLQPVAIRVDGHSRGISRHPVRNTHWEVPGDDPRRASREEEAKEEEARARILACASAIVQLLLDSDLSE